MEKRRDRIGADVFLAEPRASGIGEHGDCVFISGDGIFNDQRQEVTVGFWVPAVMNVIAMLLEGHRASGQETPPQHIGMPAPSASAESKGANVRLTMHMDGGAQFPFDMPRDAATALLSQLAAVLAS